MTLEILLSVFLFALVSTATPGPNNIMVMTSGMNFGVWRTLPHYLGICIGFPGMVLAISLGLGIEQTIWIAAAFMIVAIPSVGGWMLGGAGLRRLLQKPAYRRWFNWTMGLLLALSVIPMVSVEMADIL